MKSSIPLFLLALFSLATPALAEPSAPALEVEGQDVSSASPADESAQTYQQLINERMQESLDYYQQNAWPSPQQNAGGFKQHMALLLLFNNEQVEYANQLVLEVCGKGPNPNASIGLPEPLFRLYLLEPTRRLLIPEAKALIEDAAWEVLIADNRRVSRADADVSFWDGFDNSENHYLNFRRAYTLALAIVRMSDRYGPEKLLDGERIESHCQAWVRFWMDYLQTRATEGTDTEMAHTGSYGICTVGVYYDLHDLVGDPALRKMAADFLTLYWAEVAGEFEPRTAYRASAGSRMTDYWNHGYWAKWPLLYSYHWHDAKRTTGAAFLGDVTILTSDYRPPEILSAIARDQERGRYLATSRRMGMTRDRREKGMITDENGDSHFRRDVYYTPDYTLSTMAYDPAREYDVHLVMAQIMGATFAADADARIAVLGTGIYGWRAIIGITGTGVSMIARDPHAEPGLERFKTNGTRVFISNGPLWDNRVEDPSGWFFTRCGEAYAAIRPSGPGYEVTDVTYTWPNRRIKEVKETRGMFLELNDKWAPIVIQMGRAKDYDSFEAFQTSVKENKFDYQDGKLAYTSEADVTFEYWANSETLPKINGAKINLNPAKTYDSPFLSMEHGSNQAVISYPGYEDVVLEF